MAIVTQRKTSHPQSPQDKDDSSRGRYVRMATVTVLLMAVVVASLAVLNALVSSRRAAAEPAKTSAQDAARSTPTPGMPASFPSPHPSPAPSAGPASPGVSQFYGDFQFRDKLPEKLQAQTSMLQTEAQSQPTNAEERNTLIISPERAKELEKSGTLIF